MDLSLDSANSLFRQIVMWFKRLQFGGKAQLAFLEDFAALVNDGVPANKAIEMMAQIGTGIRREVALSIEQKISEGELLADGMRGWFNVSIVEIIRVGEQGGALGETIQSAVKTLTQRTGALGALIAALLYPLMVIIVACFVMIYLNNSVFIQFRSIKPIEQWPQAGQDLVALATGIQTWWWAFLIVIIATIIFFQKMFGNYVGELRPFLDKFPPFSIYRRFAAARLMETLGLLVANGVVFKNAIKVMQYQANPYVTSHLVMMEHLLGMGKGNIADVLQTGLIDESDILRLRVMAEVKGFEHGLIRLGIRGSEQSTQTMKLISKIMGGVLLTIGAALIILIVRGIYFTGMSMGSA